MEDHTNVSIRAVEMDTPVLLAGFHCFDPTVWTSHPFNTI